MILAIWAILSLRATSDSTGVLTSAHKESNLASIFLKVQQSKGISSSSQDTSYKRFVSMEIDDEITILYDKGKDLPKERHPEHDDQKDKSVSEITVLYDKKDDLKWKMCLANEVKIHEVRVEDIPLPPESWLSHYRKKERKAVTDFQSFEEHSTSSLPSSSKLKSDVVETSPKLKDSLNCGAGFEHISHDVQFCDIRDEVQSLKQEFGRFREWERVSHLPEKMVHKAQNVGLFTVMSYNVLSQYLLDSHPDLYRMHDPRALSWDYRMTILFQEMQEANADILCLQEVQENHLYLFESHLKSIGYHLGLYKQRTHDKVDGCAIFYKTSKFKLIESTTVEFYQDYEHGTSILDRDNVAIIIRFQLQGVRDDMQVVVATTHLLYNPRRHDIKLAQTQILLAELERMAFFGSCARKNVSRYWPVIVTGDFNLKPWTAVYNFLIDGFLQYTNLAARTLAVPSFGQSYQGIILPSILQISSNSQHLHLLEKRSKQQSSGKRSQEELQYLQIFNSDHHKSYSHFSQRLTRTKINSDKLDLGYISHSFNFRSVYSHQQTAPNGRLHSEATTFQNEWVTVDYIFYGGGSAGTGSNFPSATKGILQLLSRYSLPTRGICHRIKRLPNLVCGSDHLPLLAQFRLIPGQD